MNIIKLMYVYVCIYIFMALVILLYTAQCAVHTVYYNNSNHNS